MERTPMTKEEIALELVKLITPTDVPNAPLANDFNDYAKKVAEGYNLILKTISETSKD